MSRTFPVRSRGLALVAVMWMVAALAILAAGLTTQTRGELRSAQNARFAAQASALGDAAIQLAAFEIRNAQDLPPGGFERAFELDGYAIRVIVVPAAGLVDLNTASEPLLKDLFVIGAGLADDQAERMARQIVQWRGGDGDVTGDVSEDPAQARPRGEAFEYPEDLLQVPSVRYDDYAKIARLVTVHGRNIAVDPMSAPVEVLSVLAGGDMEVVRSVMRGRDARDSTTDLTGLNQAHLGGGGGEVFRIDAIVEIGPRGLRRTRWIDMAGAGSSGAPWRTLRLEEIAGIPSGVELEHGI